MKRARLLFLLTLAGAAAPAPRLRAQAARATDIELTEITPLSAGAAGRLCPGTGNALRVGVAWHGTPPDRPIALRLELVLPGGAATLLAEGSVTALAPAATGATSLPRSGSAATTFTFLRVDVPQRLRGRNALLVARANADQAIPEQDYSNDRRELPLDAATDWSCKGS